MMSNQNTAQPIEISPHAAALVAGLSLLMMVGLAAFAQFYVLEPLVVAQDAQATAAFTFVGEFLLIFWLLYMGIKGFANPSTERTASSRRV